MITLRGQAEVRPWVDEETMMMCSRAVVTEEGSHSAQKSSHPKHDKIAFRFKARRERPWMC